MLKGGIKSLISPSSLSFHLVGSWMYEGLEALLCEIYSILTLSMFDKSLEIKAESLGDCYI